ncbi:MAG: hypothetical protein WBS24_04460 [Terriglobales bacterium]
MLTGALFRGKHAKTLLHTAGKKKHNRTETFQSNRLLVRFDPGDGEHPNSKCMGAWTLKCWPPNMSWRFENDGHGAIFIMAVLDTRGWAITDWSLMFPVLFLFNF